MATCGGLRPATAVLRTVGRLSPLDWYCALTPVLVEKPSRTFWKSVCSVDAHFAQTVTLPPMLWAELELELELDALPPPPPPHAARARIRPPTTGVMTRRITVTPPRLGGPPTRG